MSGSEPQGPGPFPNKPNTTTTEERPRWRPVGRQGEEFRAAVASFPGWYWILRPANLGPGHFDPSRRILLLVHVDHLGHLRSPISDLSDLSSESLVCHGEAGAIWQSWFAGPVKPGPLEGELVLGSDGHADGFLPPTMGWRWCRTQAPLQHVDEAGIGPIYLSPGPHGKPWVFAAASPEGEGVDLFELGFAEPLVARWGIIDGAGEAGRTRAEFFGAIQLPEAAPLWFPGA